MKNIDVNCFPVVAMLQKLKTVYPRQDGTGLKSEQPNYFSENIIQLIDHPKCEATLTYKLRLVGEHRSLLLQCCV